MIYGIGCDIIEIKRIRESLDKYGEKFLKRIFTIDELEKGPANRDQLIAYLAKRYAAKEAYAKALGTGIGETIEYNKIEILNDDKGAPHFNNKHPLNFDAKVHLSLSDEKEYAIAYVIIEK